jgi:hypothetical protein
MARVSTKPWRPNDSEALGDALNTTRKIRFGLEVIWSEIDCLPDEIPATGAVLDALQAISDWLEQAEETGLRDALLTRNYAVIKPLSLTSPPSPATLADITAAMLVLQRHAVLITDD